jgi:ADP-heptose:LPS heptosyltransferase
MMRIIALVPGGIGDQILFFPTLDDLKQNYPNAQIDVVVEPRAKAAYRLSKTVHNTILFDFEGGNSLADWGNLLGSMREQEYDAAICLNRSWAVRFLLWLTGIPIRVGYAGGAGELFLTKAIPLQQNQYIATTYHDLLKGLEINTPCPEISVSVPAKDLDWADTERKRLGIGNSGYVLIHMGSSQLYPLESWQGIIKDFQQKQPELPLVVIKNPFNGEWADALVKAHPSLKVTFPAEPGKLTAMIAGANLMLCTDGALMHLAVAAKTYTLALFSATDPKKFLPESNRFVGIKSLTGKMADISPQTIMEKVWGG